MKKYIKKIACILAFTMVFSIVPNFKSLAEESNVYIENVSNEDYNLVESDVYNEINNSINSEQENINTDNNVTLEDESINTDENTSVDNNDIQNDLESDNSKTEDNEVLNTDTKVEEIKNEEVEETKSGDVLDAVSNTLTSGGYYLPKITTETTTTTGDANKLTLSKTATLLGNDEYEIKLNVTGKAQNIQVPTTDIVVVIDNSSSMADEIGTVKTGVNSFCQSLLRNNPTNVRFSIVSFDKTSDIELSFTSNKDNIQSAINGIKVGSGTNTQAGINRAAQVISQSRADNKYVVFFTDGFPYHYCKNDPYGSDAVNNQREAIEYAKNAFNTYFNSSTGEYKDTVFYSIGMFTNISSSDEKKAKDLLKQIQNVSTKYNGTYKDADDYINNHFTNTAQGVVDILNRLSVEIDGQINELIAKNVTITDTVTHYFEVVEGTEYKITRYGSDAVIEQGTVTLSEVDTVYGQETKKEDKVTFPVLSEVREPGITITFKVRAKDPYYYGLQVPTNTVANISFKDPLDESKSGSGEFPIPKVDIAPKMGKITTTKYVVNSEGKQAPDDTFSVLINGEGSQYNMALKSGDKNKQTMEFVLRGENDYKNDTYRKAYEESDSTDENNEAITDSNGEKIVPVENYVTVKVGSYTVDELVPMNYIKTSTIINSQSTTGFELNKNNNNIDIKITNKYVNDIYFFDKVIKSNIFDFFKLAS